MRIELDPAARTLGRAWRVLSPLIAVGLTLVAGAVIFAAQRHRPARRALRLFPRAADAWPGRAPGAAGQGDAAHHDRRRPRRSATSPTSGTSAPRGSSPSAPSPARCIPVLFPDFQNAADAAADAAPRHPRRHGLCRDPGAPEDPLRHQRDPDQPDAGLCRRATCSTGWCAGRWRDPKGFDFPGSRAFTDGQVMPIIWPGTRRHHLGSSSLLVVVAGAWFLLRRTHHRLPDQRRSARRRAPAPSPASAAAAWSR